MIKIYEPNFDPAAHVYHDDKGMRLEGVTDVLQGELSSFSGFPESAAVRGHDVHAAIQYLNQDDLKEESLNDEIMAYLNCYKAAKAALGFTVFQGEVRRFHHKYYYAGTLDAIIELNGVKGVIDWKTGAPICDHKWQLALYLEMMKHECPELKGRWNLYLKPGQYGGCGWKLVEHTGKNDFMEALALFSAYTIKKNNGYIKERRNITDGE